MICLDFFCWLLQYATSPHAAFTDVKKEVVPPHYCWVMVKLESSMTFLEVHSEGMGS